MAGRAGHGGAAEGIELVAELLDAVGIKSAETDEGLKIAASGATTRKDARAGREEAGEIDELLREMRIVLGIHNAEGDGRGFIPQGGPGDLVGGEARPKV